MRQLVGGGGNLWFDEVEHRDKIAKSNSGIQQVSLAPAVAERMFFEVMEAQEIQKFAERQPFRPFAIRLNNGAQYTFKEPRNFGAPKHYRLIIYFGDSEAVRIDTESITQIFEN